MKKLKQLGLSLFVTSFLVLNPNLTQAVTLASGDFFQITVVPDALGTLETEFTLEGGAPQNAVLAADEDIYLSELLLPPPEVGILDFSFARISDTQVDVEILDINGNARIGFQPDGLIQFLEIPSTVSVTIPADSLVELKNDQGDVLETFDAGEAAIVYDQPGVTSVLIEASVCGNSKVEPGEECDDGNQVDNDLCSNTCVVIVPECGDGIVQGDEECDDGNEIEDDSCNNLCELNAACGNGVVDEGEQCDDGNENNEDDCPNNCSLTGGGLSGNGCQLNADASNSPNSILFLAAASLILGSALVIRHHTAS